jgi:hypothetical protein
MSWHYSRALEEVYWGENSSGGEPSAPSSWIPTHGTFWSPDKTTDVSPPSRSGMTYAPSTGGHGKDVLMWFLGDFLVRTSPSQEPARESTASAAGYGVRCGESLATFDLDSCSWKTPQLSLLAEVSESLPIWPRWATWDETACWELPTPSGLMDLRARITSEIESGSLERIPTPTVCGNYNRKGASKNSGDGIATYVRRWPTPTKADGEGGPGRSSKRKGGDNLRTAVKRWPTPTVQDSKNNGAPSQMVRNTKPLNAEVGGPLNPTWVEWLMGWPLGWTDCAASATDKFQQWLHSHGRPCDDLATRPASAQSALGGSPDTTQAVPCPHATNRPSASAHRSTT